MLVFFVEKIRRSAMFLMYKKESLCMSPLSRLSISFWLKSRRNVTEDIDPRKVG
jgi:hypothetical protein